MRYDVGTLVRWATDCAAEEAMWKAMQLCPHPRPQMQFRDRVSFYFVADMIGASL